jgi:RimJ/RimL family protein N-acetyltransferase
MSREEFFERVRRVFNRPIETLRLSIVSADHIGATALLDFANADGRDFYHHASGQTKDEDFSISYIRNVLVPFFQAGQNIGNLRLFLQDKENAKLVGSMCVWQDLEGRTRLSPYTLPSLRQRGYTKESYKAVITTCDEASLFGSLHDVRAEVSIRNSVSLAFYKALGFEDCGVINTPMPNLSAEHQERFVLRKVLDREIL